jgi:hypothetical protein
LLDFNVVALGVHADECFRLANDTELKPGRELKIYLAEHFSVAS